MALELVTLAVLTLVYLVVVPHRPIWLDAGLGLVAVVAVAATSRHTREQIWAPPATERNDRLQHSTRHMLVGTSAVALLFAIVGSWTGRPGSLFKATMGDFAPSFPLLLPSRSRRSTEFCSEPFTCPTSSSPC